MTYFFMITGMLALLMTAPTHADIPSIPGSLRYEVYSDTAAELFWDRSTDDTVVVGYELQINNQLITTIDALSYFTDDLLPGLRYEFVVTAIDSDGNRSESVAVAFISGDRQSTANDQRLPSPSNLQSSVYSSSAFEVFWDRVPDVYFIYEVSIDEQHVATIDGTSWFADGLQAGQRYEVAVVAIDDEGNRSGSARLFVTTLDNPTDSTPPIDSYEPLTINTADFPEFMDAGDTISVKALRDNADANSIVVSVDSGEFLSTSVNEGNITLVAGPVTSVTVMNLVITANDDLGREAHATLPITLHPITVSGLGRTYYGQQSGPGIHLVILGDGYKFEERSLFDEHVRDFMATMKADTGIATHFTAWNVHAITIDSVESGIDDEFNNDIRDTAFDAGYNCNKLQRLICADNLAAFSTALGEYPEFDQLILLVNDPRFGGNGAGIAISTAYLPEIAIHEMGHSIAGLADEYVDNLVPEIKVAQFEEGMYANISTSDDPLRVPWTTWIDTLRPLPSQPGDVGVGIFEGGFYRANGFYRPTFDSRMRTLDAPFGPVNSEQWVLSVYAIAQPVIEFYPTRKTIELSLGESQEFRVATTFDSDLQSVEWRFNNTALVNSNDANTVTLTPSQGTHTLDLRVEDISGLIRKTPPHAAEFVWSWTIEVR